MDNTWKDISEKPTAQRTFSQFFSFFHDLFLFFQDFSPIFSRVNIFFIFSWFFVFIWVRFFLFTYSKNVLSVIGFWDIFQDSSFLVKGRFGKCPFAEMLSIICPKIIFTPGVQKWITVAPFHDIPHHIITEDGWQPLWILGTFALVLYSVRAYTLSFCLLSFYSIVKIFSSMNKIFLNSCTMSEHTPCHSAYWISIL